MRLLPWLLLLLLLAWRPIPADSAEPFMPALVGPCGSTFNQRRIPVELQSWWTPNFGHIHATVCVPLGQTAVNQLDFDARVVLHNNPSAFYELRVDDDKGVRVRLAQKPEKTCAYNGSKESTCAWSVPVKINFASLNITNGWREFRVRAQTRTPDSKKFLNSSGIPVYVTGGVGSRSDYNRWCGNKSLIGRGWYESIGYTNAIIECVPLTKVKGTIRFRVRSQDDSSRLVVELDKSHSIPAVGPWPAIPATAGRTLFDRAGNFDSWVAIDLDTRNLQNGWHSLSVMAVGEEGEPSQCSYCRGEMNLPAGVAKAWFFVEN